MSFGSTIAITINAVAKTLNRINQDNYGSEYLLRESLQEFRVRIRHQTENAKNGEEPFERHQFEVTQTVFKTSTDPEVVRQAYSVFRHRKGDSLTSVGYLTAGLVDYLDSGTVQTDLLTWQN